MASSTLSPYEVEPLLAPTSMRLADFCPGSGAASFVCEAPAFVEEKGDLYISTAKGLCGARGAMMALGIEGAAALGFYGVWQLWRLFR